MTNRRDFIKWVVYLGAAATLPAKTETKELPTDVLEGLCVVNKKIADLSDNAAQFRLQEEAAFESYMQEVWRQANGSTRFVRTVRDLGAVEAETFTEEGGNVVDRPASYQVIFQYRRA